MGSGNTVPVPEQPQPIDGGNENLIAKKEANEGKSGDFFGVGKVKAFIGSIFTPDDGGSNAIQQLLADPKAVAAFQRFLETECESDNLKFLHQIDRIKAAAGTSGDVDPAILQSMTRDLVDNFAKPEESDSPLTSSVEEIQATLLNKPSSQLSSAHVISGLEKAQNEIVILLAMGSFHKFVKSPQYQEFLAERKSGNANVTSPKNAAQSPKQASSPNNKSPRAVISPTKSLRLLDSTDNAFMLGPQGSWLNTLFKASEALPVCISLASARKDRPGFPLIFVNAIFETTTLYPREAIINTNCKFLQTRNPVPGEPIPPVDADGKPLMTQSEAASIKALTHALANAAPVKVCITNFRRDGTPFTNLLAMKPIYDSKGEYRYVVGVQFDISREDSSVPLLQLADILLGTIPDTIYGDNE